MRVLILGGDGMLGHRLMRELAGDHEVKVTLRRPLADYAPHRLYRDANSFPGLDVRDFARLSEVIEFARPQVVINAVGLVKQRSDSEDVEQALEINALLPHRLARACNKHSARLLHISTDCVFAGDRGNYDEDDLADATDVYGQTKHLGEVSGPNCITLRTSMIGLELARRASLIEWYLAQHGRIRGFTGAIYSGLTTIEFARVVRLLIEQFPELHGLYNVVAEPISKFELLTRLTTILARTDIEVEADRVFQCDRSMRGDRFRAATGYVAPSWEAMLRELADDIAQRSAHTTPLTAQSSRP